MKELYLANEPFIGRVTLPTGETGSWFYNPDTTTIARFASKVVFKSPEQYETHTFILLLPESYIDDESTSKARSIAEDLSFSQSNKYIPHFSDDIYDIEECRVER